MTVSTQFLSWHSRNQTGFTLLEILAVIVIIGVTISFASLSLSSRATEERLVNEAERLLALLELAADEAVVQGEEIGLLVASDGYAFYHLEENKWTAYQEGSLRQRVLPEGLSLHLANAGQDDVRIPLPEDKKNQEKKKNAEPHVLMLSSGEVTPFVLELRADHQHVFYQAEGKITGQIEMKRVEGLAR